MHRLIAVFLQGADGAVDGAKFRPNFCATHRGEALRWHCYDCAGATLCALCRDLAHRNHRCDDVADVEAKFRENLEVSVNRFLLLLFLHLHCFTEDNRSVYRSVHNHPPWA